MNFLLLRSSLLSLFLCLSFISHPLQAKGVTNAWEMPPIIFKDLSGKERTLKDWSGDVILLNFWATWCGPCLTEVPHFIDYQERYGKLGLKIVGVALDDEEKVRNFVRTTGINYPVLLANPEKDTKLLTYWGDPQQVLPYTVVIGRDGHMHLFKIGVLDDEVFQDYVMPLLK